MAGSQLTAERLRELLHYNPETGIFTRVADSQSGLSGGHVHWKARAGAVVGSKSKGGHLTVWLDGGARYLHRLAWLHVHGAWPESQIDHINGIRTDNRIENLRDVSHTANAQNRRDANPGSRSGLLGAHWSGARGKWEASIMSNRKKQFLGVFDNPDDAHQAYLAAKRRLHEGCTI